MPLSCASYPTYSFVLGFYFWFFLRVCLVCALAPPHTLPPIALTKKTKRSEAFGSGKSFKRFLSEGVPF